MDQLVPRSTADQAAIDSAQVQLAYTTITSPLDGRTGIRQVDQGNIVHATDTTGLVVLTQLHPISVVFTLPEQTLGKIQPHLSVGDPLTVLAVDRDNRTTLGEGKLAVIDNQIDTTTGTIRLKATFPNADLRSGRANSSMRGSDSKFAKIARWSQPPWSNAGRKGPSPL